MIVTNNDNSFSFVYLNVPKLYCTHCGVATAGGIAPPWLHPDIEKVPSKHRTLKKVF